MATASSAWKDSDDAWAIANFIAHARTDIPALCAYTREQDAQIERLKARIRHLESKTS